MRRFVPLTDPLFIFAHFMTMRHFFWILILLAAISCSTIEDCQNDPNRSYLLVGFNHTAPVSFDSVRVPGANWTDELDTLTYLGLPLDFQNTSSHYVFYTDSMVYELEVSYDYQIQIFEIDCPPSYYVFDLDTVTYTFDSLVLSQQILTNTSANADIEIFF
jgi:hypothetical protein